MRYRKVALVIWQDEKFRAFTDDGKLAFLFLLTHPAMTSVGAMRATVAAISAFLLSVAGCAGLVLCARLERLEQKISKTVTRKLRMMTSPFV